MTMLRDLITVANLGVEMRDKQKAYFKSRTREALIASKEAESVFDKAAAALKVHTDALDELGGRIFGEDKP